MEKNILRNLRLENKMGGLLSLVLGFMLWFPSVVQASSPEDDTYPTPERLFHIARSLNRNLVCYDANLKDGKLDSEEPVKVYWLNRTDRPGHTNGLNFIQRKLAYGYKVVQHDSDSYQIELSAYPRNITIRKDQGSYQAFVDIQGTPARLVSLYVKTKPNNSMSVEYVELQGYEVSTGKWVTERIEN